MNVLLTGASGFLGSHLYREISRQHRMATLGRTPVGSHHITCDLARETPVLPAESFDLVIHAAGKAHSVPRTASERADYEAVNVRGTHRLVDALHKQTVLPSAIVYLSSVLVYGCLAGESICEDASLDATDVYGISKIRAENLLREWANQTGVCLTILRLPLVVAGQPKGNLAAMQQAMRRGYYVGIGDGQARRSMVRADDVAAGLMRSVSVAGAFNLTDGQHPTVRQLEQAMLHHAGRHNLPTMPLSVARAIATLGDGINGVVGRRFPLDSVALQKLTGTLTFSDEKARQHLDWNPRPVLDLFR